MSEGRIPNNTFAESIFFRLNDCQLGNFFTVFRDVNIMSINQLHILFRINFKL